MLNINNTRYTIVNTLLLVCFLIGSFELMSQEPQVIFKVKNNNFGAYDYKGNPIRGIATQYWKKNGNDIDKNASSKITNKTSTNNQEGSLLINNSALQLDFGALKQTINYNKEFTVSMNIHIPAIDNSTDGIKDNTVLWEIRNPKDGFVYLGLYINKDGSLYVKHFAHRLLFERKDLDGNGRKQNYILPVYLPAKLDVPKNKTYLNSNPNCPDERWYRITTCFTDESTKVVVTKPCETYYDINGKIKNLNFQSKFPAQRKGAGYNAGYGGNYGRFAVQNYWVGNTHFTAGKVFFMIGDQNCLQSTEIYIDDIQFYDQELKSSFIANKL